MRIALLTDGIWPDVVGGMQKHSYYLCKYLLLNGVDVDLYFTNKDDVDSVSIHHRFPVATKGSLKCIYIPCPASIYFPGHYFWERYRFSKGIFHSLTENIYRYDFIYAQGLAGWYTLLNRKKLRSSVPILSNFHGMNLFQKVFNRRSRFEQLFFKSIIKRILLQADFVQSLGGKLTKLLLEEGLPKHKIIEFGIGIEKSWIKESPIIENKTPRSFIFIGRHDWVKGASELNTVLKQLVCTTDFNFHFVGQVPVEKRITDSRIKYYGIITEEKILKEILDQSDFIVLPSYSEGMPTVILEGMARGCAVIATDVGAVSELVSAKNGILIEAGNAPALLKALNQAVVMDMQTLIRMKNESHSLIQSQYLWEVLIEKMISFFEIKSVDAA